MWSKHTEDCKMLEQCNVHCKCQIAPALIGQTFPHPPQKHQHVVQGTRNVEADNFSGRNGLVSAGLGSLPGGCRQCDRLAHESLLTT